MRFVSLTTGSCGNCYYIESGDTAVLVDAGIGGRTINVRLRKLGITAMGMIKAVFVTHDHSDHIRGIGGVVEKFGVPVYSTEKILKGMNRCYVLNPKVDVASCRNIDKGETIELGEMRITAFEVPHDASDCVGYRIEADGKTLVIVTDIGEVTETAEKEMKGADFLVIEANYDDEMLDNGPYPLTLRNRIRSGQGHLSNAKCAEYLKTHCGDRLKNICLCHISQHNNDPQLAYMAACEALEEERKVVGEDVDLKVLPRGMSTGIMDV